MRVSLFFCPATYHAFMNLSKKITAFELSPKHAQCAFHFVSLHLISPCEQRQILLYCNQPRFLLRVNRYPFYQRALENVIQWSGCKCTRAPPAYIRISVHIITWECAEAPWEKCARDHRISRSLTEASQYLYLYKLSLYFYDKKKTILCDWIWKKLNKNL